MRSFVNSGCLGVITVGALLVLYLPSSAHAQQLEEVLVTARKKVETLQEAPVAVSAFDADTIQSRGMSSINDLAKFAPGLSFSEAFGRTNERPIIRGQSNVLANFQYGVESGTAYFVDGVYYPGDITGLDFSMLERVEVVRGPQSALYGRNTYAGAINFITRQAKSGGEMHFKGIVAQHDEHDITVSMGGLTLDGKLNGWFSARTYRLGDQWHNYFTNRGLGAESTDSLGLTLKYTPSDTLDLSITTMYRKDKDNSLPQFLLNASENNCSPGYRSPLYHQPAVAGVSTNSNQYFCGIVKQGRIRDNSDAMPVTVGGVEQFRDGTAFDGLEREEFFTSLRADWDVNASGWVLTALGGYRDSLRMLGGDDHSEALAVYPQYNPEVGNYAYPDKAEDAVANTTRNDWEDKSVEIRVASPSDGRVRGLAGLYYFDLENIQRDLTMDYPRSGVPQFTENIKNKAAFGMIEFDLTKNLTLSAELRYTKESKGRLDVCSVTGGKNDYNFFTDTCTNYGFAMQPGMADFYSNPIGTALYQTSADFESTTPRVTLDWKASDLTTFYAVYAQGAKPGGLNGLAGALVDKETYQQEESDNYEVGVKWTNSNGRLQLNASAFYTEAKDVQTTEAFATGRENNELTLIATNAGAGEIKGIEVEMDMAVTRALVARANFAYTDARITKGCDAMEYTLNSGGYILDPRLGPVPECDISGRRYPLTPQAKGSVSLDYDRALSSFSGYSLIGNLDVLYEGTKFAQVHQRAETGDTTIVNLRLGVRSDSGWSLIGFVRNLTDDDTPPLLQRWFDFQYGATRLCSSSAEPCVPATPTPGRAGGVDVSAPRAISGALRKGRSFGLEFRYDLGR